MKDYYGVLDVTATATPEEIKAQYRQLVRVYHPDRFMNPLDKVFAEEKLKEINEAYRILTSHPNQMDDSSASGTTPKPVIEPAWIDFGVVETNEKATRSFLVHNQGGPAHNIDFIYMEKAWFKVGNGRPATEEFPVPVIFDVTVDVRKLAPQQAHQGWVDVDLDGVRTRLNLGVRVAPVGKVQKIGRQLTIAAVLCCLVLIAGLALQFSGAVAMIKQTIQPLPQTTSLQRLTADQLLFVVDVNNQPLIYLSQPDGSNQRGLGIVGSKPAIAPNGRQIAFVAEVDNAPQVFLADADGRQLRQVTNSPEPKSAPGWSPDGQLIAFTVGSNEQSHLRVLDIPSNRFYDLPNKQLGGVEHFDWSPDGRTILFDVKQGDVRSIYRARPAGEDVQLFTAFDSSEPAWSPDGTRVAVASPKGIYTVDSQGRDLRQLIAVPASSPAWSFDNRRIAFLSAQDSADGALDVWVMDADGGNLQRITDEGALKFAWSSASQRLAYITGNPKEHDAILYLWITDLQNSPKLLAEMNGTDIAWTP